MDKFTIQQIFEVKAFDLEDDSLLFFSEDLKTASVENAEETVYSMGGVGNAYINGDSHSKRVTVNTEAATFNLDQVGLITGTDVATGATSVSVTEYLTITSDAATTTATATGTAGSEIVALEVLDSNGNVIEVLTQVAATPATGEFTYTSGSKALAFFASDYADGTQIRITYNATTDANAQTISNHTNVFAGQAKFVFETIVKNGCGTIFAAQLVIYKAKINGTWSFDIAADGDPAVLAMNIEALKPCGSTKLWDLILYDESALV